MKIEIKNRFTGSIIFSIETSSWRLAVEAAIKQGADLSYADLRFADLSYADLRFADLSSADLSYADLSYANLSYADLRYADLSSADLSYADLIVFRFQQHWAFYTFDGSLRIGCVVLPIVEWKETFTEIGLREKYTEEQILMYGQFINMCFEHFKRNNK